MRSAACTAAVAEPCAHHYSTLQVAQTCQLAMQRIHYFTTHPPQGKDENFRTIDPAPAAATSTPTAKLRCA